MYEQVYMCTDVKEDLCLWMAIMEEKGKRRDTD